MVDLGEHIKGKVGFPKAHLIALVQENPFVPPPVDLDIIPLVDKDRLIADTECSFDFSDLQ
jgi:hypothetical protein